jgi:Ca2+-binding EF-hand superfamily protein
MKTRYSLLICASLLLSAGIARSDDPEKPKPAPGQERKLDPDKLFDRLDKNKDGFIDKDEAPEKFKERFDKLDTNNDGKISKEEFKQAMAARQRRQGNKGGQPQPGAGNGDALFERLDKNKDGFLDKDEATDRLKERFDKLDTNKDGKISKEEFQQALKFLMRQRKGDNAPAKPSSAAPSDSKPAEKKPTATDNAKKPALPSFDSLDKNVDGRLTREELKGTSLEDKFDEIDTNKDGKIDLKEFEAYLKKSGGK